MLQNKINNDPPKISILVPLYNVEKYVERCLRSIINQTFQEFEIIVVDDFSSDKSLEIVKNLALKDKRIRVFAHTENQGLMYVRRLGIVNARGEYIFFCDSDDYIPKDALQSLYQEAVIKDSDIVVGDYVFVKNNGKEIYHHRSRKCGKTPNEMKKNILKDCKCTLWGNLYNKRIFNSDLQFFEHQSISEDRILITQLLDNCSSLSSVSKPTYYYYQNSSSLTQTKVSDIKTLSQLKAWDWLLNYYKDNSELHTLAKHFILRYLLYGIESGWNRELFSQFSFVNNLINFSNIQKMHNFHKSVHFYLCTKSRGYSRGTHSIRKFIQRIKH